MSIRQVQAMVTVAAPGAYGVLPGPDAGHRAGLGGETPILGAGGSVPVLGGVPLANDQQGDDGTATANG